MSADERVNLDGTPHACVFNADGHCALHVFTRASDDSETIVGWMVGDPNDSPAMYNRQQQEEAFDAASRWNSPITALAAHPSTPEFARGRS